MHRLDIFIDKMHLESVLIQITNCTKYMAMVDHPNYNQGVVCKRLLIVYGKILHVLYR
jgi:hypothetical protein